MEKGNQKPENNSWELLDLKEFEKVLVEYFTFYYNPYSGDSVTNQFPKFTKLGSGYRVEIAFVRRLHIPSQSVIHLIACLFYCEISSLSDFYKLYIKYGKKFSQKK